MELDEVMAGLFVRINPHYRQYLRPNGTMVVQVVKAQYGLIESGRLFYDLLADKLQSIGFVRNPVDPCVFNNSKRGIQCTIVVYVDDLFITCVDESLIKEVEKFLEKTFSGTTVTHGNVHSYLGMTFDFSVKHQVKITMDGYVKDVLSAFDVTGTAVTPATENLFASRDLPLLQKNEREIFHSGVAKLLYLAKRARPDILLPVSFLTTRVLKPNADDQAKFMRVLKYLNGTIGLGIIIRPTVDQPIGIKAYIDASYGVHDDFKSHSGMVITIGEGPLIISSSKQKLNTKSSTEAELVAMSDMCSTVIWSREFLISQGEEPGPAEVFQDNQSAMALVEKGAHTTARSRHVGIRYFWVKDRVEKGELKVTYISTDDMIADLLTKPLQGEKFRNLRTRLMNWKF